MAVVREFDPWKDPLCTCPKKYGLNPYTGCSHSCVYCYISSYIPNAFEAREKKDLISKVERDIEKMDSNTIISMSNSSDPYPPVEAKLGLTRKCLEIISKKGCRVQIITKSNIVARDFDVLKKIPCVVSFTVTTIDDSLARRLEPGAPKPSLRLATIKTLSKRVPTSLRLDPIIPFVNDDEVREIVEVASEAGVSHVTASTFKPRLDGWRRFSSAFPDEALKLRDLYFNKGEKRRGWYLPKKIREDLMRSVRAACLETGVTFSSCREGLPHLNTGGTCDGTHLIKTT
ncbi:MAG: radical SAM protein [Candidatus Hadarchaeales archaeon]